MNFFRIIYYSFLALIVAISALMIISVLPIPGNFRLMTVLSGSMEPTIYTGSVVLVKPESDYKIGDVITFGPYSKTRPPVSHRINDIKIVGGQTFYTTKGDANNAPDAREIKKNEILGKILFSVPYIGYAIETTKKPYGFLAIVIFPAAAIIAEEVMKIKKEIAKRKEVKKDV